MNDELKILQEPEGNYKKGYIKLYRSIEEHWISCNPYYYMAFNRLLFRVNHSKNTELIEGEIIDCDRGQSLYSLNSWSDIFNKKLSKRWWTIQKVRTFFKLLEKDNMIVIEGLRKTTRVTICNYDSYQNSQHTDNTEITQSQHTDNTEITTTKDIKELEDIKDIKEDKEKKFNFKKSFLELGVNEEILNDWMEVRKKKKASNTKTAYTKFIKQVNLSGLTVNECVQICAEKDWKGFEAEWLNNLNYKSNGNTKKQPATTDAELIEVLSKHFDKK